jgi:hypothetical protein
VTWVKIDDRAREHRKQLRAGAEACWLWACGLMYCNTQKARDGFIPDEAVPLLFPLRNATKHAAKLVEVGLWERADGGYRVHDYHDYQPTHEQAVELSLKRAAAGRAGGTKSGESRRSKREASCFEANEASASSKTGFASVCFPKDAKQTGGFASINMANSDVNSLDKPAKQVASTQTNPVPVPISEPKPPNPLPAERSGGFPEVVEAPEWDPAPLRLPTREHSVAVDPMEFRERLKRHAAGGLGCEATMDQDRELARHLRPLFARGWGHADADVAGAFVAVGGLRGKRGRRADVDWLVRGDGGNLVSLLERSRDWDRSGRPALDDKGNVAPAKPALVAPLARASPHATGELKRLEARRVEVNAAREAERTKAAGGGTNG